VNNSPNKFVLMNVFTPKPGKMDAFLQMQIDALPNFTHGVQGWRGGRLYRAEDASRAVMVSIFDSADDFLRFADSADFAAHRTKMMALLDGTDPGGYELVYEAGEA
jgi:heme-degrading monooxygenase HmoA